VEWTAIAMVEVQFPEKTLSEDEVRVIEEFLRPRKELDNLVIYTRKMTFYIWSKAKVGYKLLDDLKNQLKILGFKNFAISAKEYAESGNNYYYSTTKKR
jgi:hypothetical protein